MQKTKEFLFRMLCGFFLGISVVAPGVSGGVLAVVMGVYRDLIGIISNPFKHFKHNFFYLLPMGIGALLSIVISVKVLNFAFEHYSTQSQLLFMGLIAGGFIEISRRVREEKFRKRYLIAALAAFAVVLAMGLFAPAGGAAAHPEPALPLLCLAGLAGGIASVIPGVSVSLVLMLFGVYSYLLKTASGFAQNFGHFLSVAIPVGICFIAGMMLFSRLLKIVFDSHRGAAYYAIIGLLTATLAVIFKGAVAEISGRWGIGVLCFLAGLIVSAGFQFLGARLNKDRE